MQIRPPSFPEDLPAVEALLARCRAVDGRDSLSEHKLLDLRHEEGAHPGAVATLGGEVVGFASGVVIPGRDVAEVEIALDPEVRSVAAYQQLAEAAVAALSVTTAHMWAWHPYHVAALRSRDAAAGRQLHRLERALPPDEEPRLPDGVEIRPFRPGVDDDRWLAAHNLAFASHPEAGMWTPAWLDERISRPWFDAAGFLLAWDGPDIASYCWTKVHPDGFGEIFMIGVVPRYQGRGLGKAMSLAGLHHLWRTGKATRAMLYADGTNAAGLTMYRSLGFEIARTDLCFEIAR